ncbi:MAG: hypothetical protein ACOCUQ_02640 [Bacteroidota bacterium]
MTYFLVEENRLENPTLKKYHINPNESSHDNTVGTHVDDYWVIDKALSADITGFPLKS